MKHRTAIITAASIAVVIAAATAAIATNLGILDNATTSADVGVLTVETLATDPGSAASTADAPPAEIVFVEDSSATSTETASASGSTGELAAYAVGDAGIVTLTNDGSTLTIVDVEASPGWMTAQILDGTSVDIGFVSADGGSLQFLAQLDADGGIVTVVNDLAAQATVVVTETVYEDGTPANSSTGTYDDDDDRYEDNDDGDDDDRYEDDDDDDDDRYEDDDDD